MRIKFKHISLAVLIFASTNSQGATEDLYYDIGGAVPFSVSAGRGYVPSALSLGVSWNASSSCNGFDIGATVSNQLNGLTTGFSNMMGSVIHSATGAVAALPGMIIQRANPGLYDMLQNGVLQGRVDFDAAKLSCESMATAAADFAMSGGWMQKASGEAWDAASTGQSDAVKVRQDAEDSRGNDGITSIGGLKKGGTGQPAIKIVTDVVYAGFNSLHGRTNSASSATVTGGGNGWGSVSTGVGDWGGAAMKPVLPIPSDCKGGMCTLWKDADDAAGWVTDVLGETAIKLCDGCEKSESISGSGLNKKLETEFNDVYSNLSDLVSGATTINANSLQGVSAGESLVVNRKVVESIQTDPAGALLAQRLASEVAFARTITKAMWARRTLMAGMNDPNITENGEYTELAQAKLDALNTEVNMLREEMEIRTMLASNAASTLLARASNRSINSSVREKATPESRLDSFGAPK
jgi:hypothetical protein